MSSSVSSGTPTEMDAVTVPQQPIEANAEVLSVEWLFEPFWPGIRLLARRSGGRVHLTDAAGDDIELAPELRGAGDVLAASVLAADAVVDGIWTAQPFIRDRSPDRAWAETLAAGEREADAARDAPRGSADDDAPRRAFVAVDLVEIDGQPLGEVPFQERRRLLESVIEVGVHVRLSPIVKQPLAGWLVAWRANGFTHYVAKHMNSRYRPGQRIDPGRGNEEWLKLSLRTRAPRGFFTSMLGGRGDRVRRISD